MHCFIMFLYGYHSHSMNALFRAIMLAFEKKQQSRPQWSEGYRHQQRRVSREALTSSSKGDQKYVVALV